MGPIILTGDASEVDYPLIERYLNELTDTQVLIGAGLTSSMQGLVRTYCQRNGRFVRPLWSVGCHSDLSQLAKTICEARLPVIHFFDGEDDECVAMHELMSGSVHGYFPVLL